MPFINKKKDPVAVTPEEKIEKASTKVAEAHICLEQARSAIEEANNELYAAVGGSEGKIAFLTLQLEKEYQIKEAALKEIETNNELASRLSNVMEGTN